jgi:hypothetical protein
MLHRLRRIRWLCALTFGLIYLAHVFVPGPSLDAAFLPSLLALGVAMYYNERWIDTILILDLLVFPSPDVNHQ